MPIAERRLGDLLCRVVSKESEAQNVVVLCHGYGAPGTDLVGLANTFYAMSEGLKHTHFYFPEAPNLLPNMYDARAWWPIDMMRLGQAMREGKTRNMRDEIPEGLKSARQKLSRTIDAICAEHNLSRGNIVIGGFSQGAMLTTELALQSEDAFAALVVFSGALLNQETWKKHAKKRKGFRVFQSHGTLDPLLGFEQAQDLKALFDDAEFQNQFVSFDDGHTIPLKALQGSAAFLTEGFNA